MSRGQAGATLATFSLVCGLLGIVCFGLPAIPAVLLGHIALGHIGSAPTMNARGRAWLGLLLGYINIAVFGVLALLMAIGIAVGPDQADRTEAPEAASEEATAPVDRAAPPLPAAVDGQNQDDDVFLVEGDVRFHTFFCRLTSDANAQRTRVADAKRAGFRPCEVCQPGQR